MKKFIALALLLSFMSLNTLPVFADDLKVSNTPKQFKSMVKKINTHLTIINLHI